MSLRVFVLPNDNKKTIWYNRVDVSQCTFDVWVDPSKEYTQRTYRLVDTSHNREVFAKLLPLLESSGFFERYPDVNKPTQGTVDLCIQRFGISTTIAQEASPPNNRRASHLLEQEEIQ